MVFIQKFVAALGASCSIGKIVDRGPASHAFEIGVEVAPGLGAGEVGLGAVEEVSGGHVRDAEGAGEAVWRRGVVIIPKDFEDREVNSIVANWGPALGLVVGWDHHGSEARSSLETWRRRLRSVALHSPCVLSHHVFY